MREILFRGKRIDRIDKDAWVEGWVRPWPSGAAQISGATALRMFHVDPDTVGQYTGLTDINGKKIFEGDVVKHYNFPHDPEEFVVGVIYWDQIKCQWRKTSPHDEEGFNIASFCRYEVIGNIHDNPDLVEVHAK